jgi:hypothetical protein
MTSTIAAAQRARKPAKLKFSIDPSLSCPYGRGTALRGPPRAAAV